MELYYFDLRLHVLVPAVPYVSVLFPTLSVYINRSKIEIRYLDVLIRISTNNNIITDIFSKDTDTHMYLELYYFDLRLHVLVPAVPYVSVLFPTLSVYHVQLFPPDIVDFSNTI
jgi:hypothetical protein